ncbi:MAG: glycine zipper family protein [Bacteroidales bacterium]|jgi:hypothetical protein|nr:glycine zipper family protein [Bacteroidales bacterium]
MEKRNLKLFIVLFVVALVTGTGFFCACTKDEEGLTPIQSRSKELKEFEEIDKISSEMADFHTYVMKKFLEEERFGNNVLDQNAVDEIVNFIKKEMSNYDFKYIEINQESIHFLEIMDIKNIEAIISFSKNNYDFSKVELNLSYAKPSELKDYIATLNTILIEEKCKKIEDNMLNLIGKSETFQEFKLYYLKFIENELVNVQTKNEYTYIRYFADISLSSIEYITEFLCENNSKGKFGDMLKEGWNIAKPIVAADAGGAVIGAMAGAIGSGPGIVAGGMTGAIGSSAGYCIGNLISRL